MILTRTPYRISLLGGGSDYPEWWRRYGGAVLGVALDQHCYIAVRPCSYFGRRYKVICAQTEEHNSLDEIKHPAVRECLRTLGVRSCEIHHFGDLPARSGVGSSSAFVVGLLVALRRLRCGHHPTSDELAREAIYVERQVLGEVVGCQDQHLCARGGLLYLRFCRMGEVDVHEIHKELPAECGALERRLLLFHTGIRRVASDVARSYISRMNGECEGVMRRTAALAEEGVGCLRREDWDGLGALIAEGWNLKRALGGLVTSVELDRLVETALCAGAQGAKITGAGGGGFLLVYCRPDNRDGIRAALSHLQEVPVKFDFQGCRVIYDGLNHMGVAA